jgi:hypothetical protein
MMNMFQSYESPYIYQQRGTYVYLDRISKETIYIMCSQYALTSEIRMFQYLSSGLPPLLSVHEIFIQLLDNICSFAIPKWDSPNVVSTWLVPSVYAKSCCDCASTSELYEDTVYHPHPLYEGLMWFRVLDTEIMAILIKHVSIHVDSDVCELMFVLQRFHQHFERATQ